MTAYLLEQTQLLAPFQLPRPCARSATGQSVCQSDVPSSVTKSAVPAGLRDNWDQAASADSHLPVILTTSDAGPPPPPSVKYRRSR